MRLSLLKKFINPLKTIAFNEKLPQTWVTCRDGSDHISLYLVQHFDKSSTSLAESVPLLNVKYSFEAGSRNLDKFLARS